MVTPSGLVTQVDIVLPRILNIVVYAIVRRYWLSQVVGDGSENTVGMG